MSFLSFIGHNDAKLALILNAIDPKCGGVLFAGEKGSGKSTLARQSRQILPPDRPFLNLPLNVTEDALLGGIDLEDAIRQGRPIQRDGLLKQAAGGIVYIDDINLLSPEIAALVFKGQDGPHPSHDRPSDRTLHHSFTLFASMNADEGHLSPHFLDRFGLCIFWEGLKDVTQRVAVMKAALMNGDASHQSSITMRRLRERIRNAGVALPETFVPSAMEEAMIRACTEYAVAGHRGDIFLYYAARAYAALCGDREVRSQHLETVLPLVLLHRKRLFERMAEDETQKQHHHDKPADEKEGQDRKGKREEDLPHNHEAVQNDQHREDAGRIHERPGESGQTEEVFEVGENFKVRRLVFRKDRLCRAASGRRTKTASLGKRGQRINSILRPNDDIALDATIRAAAPFQIARGRKENLIIHDADLRYKQREKKMSHLVILVVDGSGSMGAQKRMTATKGAVQSLLLDCYQKRDRVSLIVFRKDRAEIVLPPTSSVAAASRKLRDIPVGGKTPLTAGMLSAYNLARQVRLNSPETRFLIILVTDGRANQSISGMPVREEIPKMVKLLGGLPSTDHIVIDTEDKKSFTKADLAWDVATMLDADYYQVDDLKASHLTEIVRSQTTMPYHSPK